MVRNLPDTVLVEDRALLAEVRAEVARTRARQRLGGIGRHLAGGQSLMDAYIESRSGGQLVVNVILLGTMLPLYIFGVPALACARAWNERRALGAVRRGAACSVMMLLAEVGAFFAYVRSSDSSIFMWSLFAVASAGGAAFLRREWSPTYEGSFENERLERRERRLRFLDTAIGQSYFAQPVRLRRKLIVYPVSLLCIAGLWAFIFGPHAVLWIVWWEIDDLLLYPLAAVVRRATESALGRPRHATTYSWAAVLCFIAGTAATQVLVGYYRMWTCGLFAVAWFAAAAGATLTGEWSKTPMQSTFSNQ